MKTSLIMVCALFLASGCSSSVQKSTYFPVPSSSAPTAAKPAPQNDDPLFWDFGSVAAGTVVKHEFTIRNNSARAMAITGVVTSCGCTASDVGKKTLAPGEETNVAVSFNSKGYKGQVSQFVYVNTDDPDRTVLKFTIKAFVQ